MGIREYYLFDKWIKTMMKFILDFAIKKTDNIIKYGKSNGETGHCKKQFQQSLPKFLGA